VWLRRSAVAVLAALAAGLTLSPAHASGIGSCPAVVIVAARGTDQNKDTDQYFGPQQYVPDGAVSNGYEGPNLTGLFRLAESRNPTTMEDVYVLSLDEEQYPATMGVPTVAETGEEISTLELFKRVGVILHQAPLGDLIQSAALKFQDSLETGQRMAPQVVDNFEASTGCAPRYITAGYSQGAIIGTGLEDHLAAKGRLVGGVYMGNPLARPNVKDTVGTPARGGGLLEAVPTNYLPSGASSAKHLDYCLRGDFVCDLTVASTVDAINTRMKVHGSYFQGEASADDARVADELAGWIKEAKAY